MRPREVVDRGHTEKLVRKSYQRTGIQLHTLVGHHKFKMVAIKWPSATPQEPH
jgi:hypothetical protein